MNFLKKTAISFVLAIVWAVIVGDPKQSGSNWVAFYITASLMQWLCIDEYDNTKHYKKIFLHAIWIAIIKTCLSMALNLYMIKATNQLHLSNIEMYLGLGVGLVLFYVSAILTGLLTVLWCNKTKQKKIKVAPAGH